MDAASTTAKDSNASHGLPVELWLAIFEHLAIPDGHTDYLRHHFIRNTTKALHELRLVCKAWDVCIHFGLMFQQ